MRTIPNVNVIVEFKQTFSESEARALDALVGYGIEPFLKVFYPMLGESYMKPHEAGLRALFASIEDIRVALAKVDDQRRVIEREIIARAEARKS